jgi:hypothetical protein
MVQMSREHETREIEAVEAQYSLCCTALTVVVVVQKIIVVAQRCMRGGEKRQVTYLVKQETRNTYDHTLKIFD